VQGKTIAAFPARRTKAVLWAGGDFGPPRQVSRRDLVQLRWTDKFSFVPLFFSKRKVAIS
jgi:hypothetical protein